ncbi:hypothetical protein GGTG_02630 [Gaeumannomyces tritici R3-111a-1]|uniref:HypA protein n=1 Tax=Gaeumannomyces tritici (strain R3-111a-1) TaxID=644352 RepID=J3NMX2_GAET3|nr:hypothetical protein GGTG_02630 [Gaeumannomyces tritici R3-111a-1]EJT77523.1 hypothetical protein GGTG_02630 [Gaeumannomyces tritici R3-111a-1]
MILPRLLPGIAQLSRVRYSPFYTRRQTSTAASTMATPYRIHLVPENTGLLKIPTSGEAARKASELLQQDIRDHHVFFNDDGFHNHIPHHIFALYGTGASAASLQRAYDANASYQRPALPLHSDSPSPSSGPPEPPSDWAAASKLLGRASRYPDLLAFFQREMDRRGPGGWRDVLVEHALVADRADARATDTLVRLLSGFVHPLIQLMYGVEWEQPAVVAEALAQACVHGDEIRDFLVGAEALADEKHPVGGGEEEGDDYRMPPIASLYEQAAADAAIAGSVRNEDGNKLVQGALTRARDELVALAAKVRVRPGELEERTVEMFNQAVFVAASAAAHPTKHPKFDFFLMHHVNVAPIFLTVNAAPWIPTDAKVRLLEWKIRLDLAQYAARAVPPMSVDRIAGYRPRADPSTAAAAAAAEPIDVASRLHDFDDDGHAIKLARAAAICMRASAPYEDRDWMRLRGRENWMKVLNMIADSVEAPGERWVRTTGLKEAWRDIEDAPKL